MLKNCCSITSLNKLIINNNTTSSSLHYCSTIGASMIHVRRNFSTFTKHFKEQTNTTTHYSLNKLFPTFNPNINNNLLSKTNLTTNNTTNSIKQSIGSGSGEGITIQQNKGKINSSPKRSNKNLKFNSLSIITKHTVTFNEAKDDHHHQQGKNSSSSELSSSLKLVPQISAGTTMLRINHDPIGDVMDLNKLGSSMNTIKASNKIQHYRLHAIIYNWNSVIECLNFESKLLNTFTLKQLMNKIANVLSNPNSDFYVGGVNNESIDSNNNTDDGTATVANTTKNSATVLNNGKILHFAFLSREIIECISSINNPLYREMISNISNDTVKSPNYDIVYKLDDELLKKHDIKL